MCVYMNIKSNTVTPVYVIYRRSKEIHNCSMVLIECIEKFGFLYVPFYISRIFLMRNGFFNRKKSLFGEKSNTYNPIVLLKMSTRVYHQLNDDTLLHLCYIFHTIFMKLELIHILLITRLRIRRAK